MDRVRCDTQAFRTLTQDMLSRGISFRFRAQGRSMYPFVKDGDILEIRPVEATEANVGDVIFYEGCRDTLVAHRLVDKAQESGRETVLITRGDAATHCDPPLPPGALLGRVVSIQRDGKTMALDRGLIKVLGIAWARLPFLGSTVYPAWRRARARIREMMERLEHLLVGISC